MQALDFYVNTINALIGEGEIKEAIDQLLKLNKAANLDMDGTLINLKGQYNRLRRETDGGYIDRRDAHIYMNRIQLAISNLLEDVPRKIELQQKLNGTTGYDFTVETNDTFEKIIGSQDNLLKISWLEQAITAAKSVCLIVGANGSKGTGFMTADNYLITNNHVIPNRAFARSAYITFNFEEDVLGRAKTSHQYRLDADDFITSDREALDITRVRVKENPDAHPLSFWGHLVFHPDIPAPRTPVTIIQHPEGKVKRIALQANEVVGNKAQYLFYTTDTLAGSSGSPVFDRDWRVVAVHHAGSSFNNRPANRGI
ncbi:MAG: trypsin-like peptidase domain-containing protein, partial [Bacteroidota bacterium]